MITLVVLLRDLKGTMPSPFRVTIENHSHTIRISRSKVAATKSTTVDDINL